MAQQAAIRQHLDSYVAEFLWRQSVKAKNYNAFDEMLSVINELWPPSAKLFERREIA